MVFEVPWARAQLAPINNATDVKVISFILDSLHRFVLEATQLLGPAEIASVAELPRGTIDTALHRMAADGEVVQVSRGRYAHPSKDFANPNLTGGEAGKKSY